jgi:D-psicose/D-tagatose/L-ribulose 3-epimerase
MKYGVCGGPEIARIAKKAGYDYFEWSVGGLLRPREEEQVFLAALKEAQEVGFPCPAVNVFVPADLKITGPNVDLQALETFVTTALRRAEIAGVETIVFGSGGARNVPEGFDRKTAWQQLVNFCQLLGPLAEKYHVTIVVEPLNKSESNIINTVGEGADLVRQVDHPNIRLLADGYHWGKDQDSVEGIVTNGSLLAHAHVATVEGRRPPQPDDTCAPFFTALVQAGYDGRVSIEGNIGNPEADLPQALEIMRRAA